MTNKTMTFQMKRLEISPFRYTLMRVITSPAIVAPAKKSVRYIRQRRTQISLLSATFAMSRMTNHSSKYRIGTRTINIEIGQTIEPDEK